MVMQRFPAVTERQGHCRGCSTLWPVFAAWCCILRWSDHSCVCATAHAA